MNKTIFFAIFCTFVFSASAFSQLIPQSQSEEETILSDSANCLKEIMEIPSKSIPESLFQNAEGVAIFPNMVKGSFILGGQHGDGILIIKNKDGLWEAPRFMQISGGSIGFQAGLQAVDVILVFCTEKSINAALQGNFTIGADLAVTAGPVGRNASAGTDIQFKSEIYSYSRSRGVFLGASLDGCVLHIDDEVNKEYYAQGLTESAKELVQLVKSYVEPKEEPQGPPAAPTTLEPTPAPVVEDPFVEPASGGNPEKQTTIPVVENNREKIRQMLVTAHAELTGLLNPEWKTWLALPPEVLQPGASNTSTQLLTLQDRFQLIENDPKYTELASRKEFKNVKMLLNQYLEK